MVIGDRRANGLFYPSSIDVIGIDNIGSIWQCDVRQLVRCIVGVIRDLRAVGDFVEVATLIAATLHGVVIKRRTFCLFSGISIMTLEYYLKVKSVSTCKSEAIYFDISNFLVLVTFGSKPSCSILKSGLTSRATGLAIAKR